MKVLITGSTYSHSHGSMFFTGSPTVSQHLCDGLVMAGHKVTMRQPNLIIDGKESMNYDRVLFGLTPSGSISARFMYYEMDLFMRCKKLKIPTAWFIDDWQWYQIASHMRTLMNTYDKRAAQLAGTRRKGTSDYFMSVKSSIFKIYNEFLIGRSSPIIMVFFDPEGPLELHAVKRMMGNKIMPVDPSGVFPKVKVDMEAKRKKQWVLAALGDYSKWLSGFDFKWPVEVLGPTAGRKDHMPEVELIQSVYGKSWGQIIPEYPVKVGKLWRSRYVHSILAGNIALTTSEEVKSIFGLPYCVPSTEVEKIGLVALKTIADEQRKAFKHHTWSADHFAYSIDKFVRGLK